MSATHNDERFKLDVAFKKNPEEWPKWPLLPLLLRADG